MKVDAEGLGQARVVLPLSFLSGSPSNLPLKWVYTGGPPERVKVAGGEEGGLSLSWRRDPFPGTVQCRAGSQGLRPTCSQVTEIKSLSSGHSKFCIQKS